MSIQIKATTMKKYAYLQNNHIIDLNNITECVRIYTGSADSG